MSHAGGSAYIVIISGILIYATEGIAAQKLYLVAVHDAISQLIHILKGVGHGQAVHHVLVIALIIHFYGEVSQMIRPVKNYTAIRIIRCRFR